MRRTVFTHLGSLGISIDVRDKVTGHIDRRISRHYDKWSYLPQKIAALELWDKRLTEIIS